MAFAVIARDADAAVLARELAGDASTFAAALGIAARDPGPDADAARDAGSDAGADAAALARGLYSDASKLSRTRAPLACGPARPSLTSTVRFSASRASADTALRASRSVACEVGVEGCRAGYRGQGTI